MLFSQNDVDNLPVIESELAKKIQEPHPSWTNAIEREWLKRYGGGAPSKGDE